MSTLFKYVGAIIALWLAIYVLAHVGEGVRDITPAHLHRSLAIAGAGLATAALISLAVFKVPPFSINVRAWKSSMVAGLIAGLILFCFYISDVECETTGRGGVSCSYSPQ